MIFVILGTQKFQFNRLLEMLDNLVAQGIITEPICAQIGNSTYKPVNYDYQEFFTEAEFREKIAASDMIIAHGGLGSMMTSMKLDKKVIVVPRSVAFGEHVDDHQYQLAILFQEKGHVLMAENESQLIAAYEKISDFCPVPYRPEENYIESALKKYINQETMEEKEKVLMIGSDLSVKGGIVSVIRNFLYCNCWKNVDVLFVPTHIEGSIFQKLLYFYKAQKKIKKVIKLQNIKLVHIHVSERGSFLRKSRILKLAQKRGCKVILHHHGAEFEQYYQNSSAKQKAFIADVLKRADLNLVLSKRLVPMIQKISPQAKIEVLYNAVKTMDKNQYRPDAREMMMLGRLEQRKGTFELLEVIKEIDEKLPQDIRFRLCGDGDLEKVHAAIQKLEIGHRIAHVGWIQQKQKESIFKDSMCHILFSHNEGLPMAILETMSYGLVNISTNVASIPEVVINDKTGILVEAGDKEALGKAILKIAKDSEYRKKLSENAYQLINENFSLEKNVKILESYYKELLKK